MILLIYDYHNKQFEQLVKREEFAIGTLKKFKTAYNSLEAFIGWKFKMNDYPVSKISNQFIIDYEFYLKTIQQNQHNTAMLHIKKLKKIVRLRFLIMGYLIMARKAGFPAGIKSLTPYLQIPLWHPTLSPEHPF